MLYIIFTSRNPHNFSGKFLTKISGLYENRFINLHKKYHLKKNRRKTYPSTKRGLWHEHFRILISLFGNRCLFFFHLAHVVVAILIRFLTSCLKILIFFLRFKWIITYYFSILLFCKVLLKFYTDMLLKLFQNIFLSI